MEWENEPNKLDFESNGFQCRIRRIDHSGHLCGYVGIDKNHRLYGIDYMSEEIPRIDVHGGITFSAKFKNSDLWWFGFDCAHLGDFCPKQYFRSDEDIYRNIGYVKNETENLADQLKSLQ